MKSSNVWTNYRYRTRYINWLKSNTEIKNYVETLKCIKKISLKWKDIIEKKELLEDILRKINFVFEDAKETDMKYGLTDKEHKILNKLADISWEIRKKLD